MSVPVVLIHGFTGSSAAWSGIVEDGRAATGRPWIAIDLPGHGAAPPTRVGVGDWLESSLDLIAAEGSPELDVVGYSMGGRIALHFAVRYPERVRRLVLESASPGLENPEEREARRVEDEALASRIEEIGVEAFVDEWERTPLLRGTKHRSPEARVLQRTARMRHRAGGLAEALRALGTGTLPALWHHLPDLPVPTLLLAGIEDRKFVELAHRMAEALPRSAVEVVPEAGHTVHLDRPDLWMSAVLGHLGGGR